VFSAGDAAARRRTQPTQHECAPFHDAIVAAGRHAAFLREGIGRMHAQAQAGNNPMQALLLPAADAIETHIDCDCQTIAKPGDITTVLDRVASSKLLFDVGSTADTNNQSAISTIYLSEALRSSHRF
jgi:hypothetical protein